MRQLGCRTPWLYLDMPERNYSKIRVALKGKARLWASADVRDTEDNAETQSALRFAEKGELAERLHRESGGKTAALHVKGGQPEMAVPLKPRARFKKRALHTRTANSQKWLSHQGT